MRCIGRLLLGAVLIPGTTQAQCELDKLLASDGAAADNFGISVVIDGETILAGAPANSASSGSAYVFRFDGSSWNEQQKLAPADGAPGDQFGFSVALCGATAVVGAQHDDDLGDDSGSAYVFERVGSSWTQTAKLLPDDGAALDRFGFVVAVSGSTAVVGTLHQNIGEPGAAYVFERGAGDAWRQTARLVPDDGRPNDGFGLSVAIDGQTIVVGASFHNEHGEDSGSVYVFDRVGGAWFQTAELIPGDGAFEDYFGRAVAISGDAILVGAIRDDDNGRDSGSAYLFERAGKTWHQAAKLLASDGHTDELFGFAVTVSDDVSLVGSFRHRHGVAQRVGAAYRFARTPGQLLPTDELLTSDRALDDRFSVSVSASGDRGVMGAHFDDDNGTNSGSAYVFAIGGADDNENLIPDVCEDFIEPSGFDVLFGQYQSGGVDELRDRDDTYVVIDREVPPQPQSNPAFPFIRMEVDGTAAYDTPASLNATIETAATSLRPPQQVAFYNYEDETWEIVDERTATPDDSLFNISIQRGPGRFIEDETHAVRLRIDWLDPGEVGFPAWQARIDQVLWSTVD